MDCYGTTDTSLCVMIIFQISSCNIVNYRVQRVMLCDLQGKLTCGSLKHFCVVAREVEKGISSLRIIFVALS